MSRPARVPAALTRGPFTVAEAAVHGISPRQLEGRAWRRVGRGLYVWAELEVDPVARLAAVLRRLPPGSACCGMTAAWLHGLEMRLAEPFEVTIPVGAGVSGRAGLVVRKASLGADDVVRCRGLVTTSVLRTLVDLARTLPLVDAVVLVDAALHARAIALRDLHRRVERACGRPGSRRLREVTCHAEPKSESPMETRLRMLLVLSGLPRPQAQVNLRDRFGLFLARADLYYPARRLCIEFDGGIHRDTLVADNRRQNRLVNAGYTLLRFTGPDVLARPEAVVREVSGALGWGGIPGYPTPNARN